MPAPTPEQQAAFRARLAAIAEVGPGSLIRAEDWRSLAALLGDLANQLFEQPVTAAVPAHDHVDQVQLGWLDTRTRTLLEQGPLNEPTARAKLDDVDRRVTDVAASVDRLAAELRALRGRVGGLVTNDVIRQNDVTRVGRLIDGLGDAREQVTDLRGSLDSIRGDVRTAVEVGSRLEGVDVSGLASRVDRLDRFRIGLSGPADEPFTRLTLEARLSEVRAGVVTQAELEDALNQRPVVIDDATREGLRDTIRTAVLADVQPRIDAVQPAVLANVDQRLAGVDARVDAAVAAAVPGVAASVRSAVRADIDQSVGRLRTETTALIDRRIDEVTVINRRGLDDIGVRVGSLETSTSARFERVDRERVDLRGQLDGIKVQVDRQPGEFRVIVAEQLRRDVPTILQTELRDDNSLVTRGLLERVRRPQ